jgi:alpha-tubulin suppressor-like RCC1 family protein
LFIFPDYKNIYVIGQNWLGTDNNQESIYETHLPDPEEKVAVITGGSFHMMALTESGKLYSAGEDSAKLGRVRSESAKTWDIVESTKNSTVTCVSCIGDNSVVITADGTVYLFCSNYSWSVEPTDFVNKTQKFIQPRRLVTGLHHVLILASMFAIRLCTETT